MPHVHGARCGACSAQSFAHTFLVGCHTCTFSLFRTILPFGFLSFLLTDINDKPLTVVNWNLNIKVQLEDGTWLDMSAKDKVC